MFVVGVDGCRGGWLDHAGGSKAWMTADTARNVPAGFSLAACWLVRVIALSLFIFLEPLLYRFQEEGPGDGGVAQHLGVAAAVLRGRISPRRPPP